MTLVFLFLYCRCVPPNRAASLWLLYLAVLSRNVYSTTTSQITLLHYQLRRVMVIKSRIHNSTNWHSGSRVQVFWSRSNRLIMTAVRRLSLALRSQCSYVANHSTTSSTSSFRAVFSPLLPSSRLFFLLPPENASASVKHKHCYRVSVVTALSVKQPLSEQVSVMPKDSRYTKTHHHSCCVPGTNFLVVHNLARLV